jgi:hypothetical protein
VLIVKNGSAGIKIFGGGAVRNLPAPSPKSINTDVGCGDLLVGALAGHILQNPLFAEPVSFCDLIESAYKKSLDLVTKLIESRSAYEFVTQCIREIGGKYEVRNEQHYH